MARRTPRTPKRSNNLKRKLNKRKKSRTTTSYPVDIDFKRVPFEDCSINRDNSRFKTKDSEKFFQKPKSNKKEIIQFKASIGNKKFQKKLTLRHYQYLEDQMLFCFLGGSALIFFSSSTFLHLVGCGLFIYPLVLYKLQF